MGSELDNLCERIGVRMTAVAGANRKPGWAGSFGHRVCLSLEGRRLTIDFHTGAAARVFSPADVLSCLVLDATAAEQSFEDFCSDMGYQEDSRAALRTYKACVAMSPRVRRFLGDHWSAVRSAEH